MIQTLRTHLKSTPYDIPLLIFLFSACLSLGVGYDPGLGWPTLLALGAGCILFAVISRLNLANRAWHVAAGALVLLAGALSIFFVTQAGHLQYDDKVDFIVRLESLISAWVPDFHLWKPMPNSVGTFLEGSFFTAIGLYLGSPHSKYRWIPFCTAILIALALLFSSSRGAWLAVAGAGLIWAGLHWKPARYVAFAAAGGLAALILYTLIYGDITAINQIPIANKVLGPLFIRPDRLEVYRNSLALIADVPFSGIGLGGQFALVYSRYELLIQVPFLYYSHNLLLEIWLEQGLLGIASWIAILVSIYIHAWSARNSLKDLRFESTWIGLTAIFLHGVTDAREYQDLWCWLPFFILLGLNAAMLGTAPRMPRRPSQGLIPAAVALLFISIVLVRFWPISASARADLASVLQQRADLSPNLAPAARDEYRTQAASEFRQVLAQQPKNRTANQRLGLYELDLYQYPAAIANLEEALRSSPRHPGTRKALGLAYAFSGNFTTAVPLLTGLPNIADELDTWGWYLSTNQHLHEAINAYQMSLTLSPNQPAVITEIEKIQKNLSP